MLNAGFTTLDTLKNRLLPEAARTDTEYDSALSDMGLSIAKRIENHCNRRFARNTAAVDEFSAWNLSITLRGYPVESITSIQIRDADGTLVDSEMDYSLDEACGLIDFHAVPGAKRQRLVVTYVGGFWLDPDDGTAMPSGAQALPYDLREIWLAEVQRIAEARGTFEAVGLRAHSDAAKTATINGLSQDTVAALSYYRRFSGE